MSASAKALGEHREIHVAIGTAAQAYALAAQIEQRYDGAVLSFVQVCRDFAAVTEAARSAHLDAIRKRSVNDRRPS